MSSISSFDIISIVFPEPRIFLCIHASAADAAAVIPNEIKTPLANGFFFNFSSMVKLFLVMDQGVYQEVLLIALF